MLINFKFSNFRCFADETEFDMTATSIKEHGYSLIENNGVNILPVAAVYGANAGGKSSFFMAMDRMRSVIVDKFVAKNSSNDLQPKPFSVPFMFSEDSKVAPAFYEVTLLIEGYKYRYGFTCSKDSILSEYLYKQKNSKGKTLENLIYERTTAPRNIKYGKTNAKTLAEVKYCNSMSSDRILLLTDIGMREKCDELCKVFNWFFECQVLLNIVLEIMSRGKNSERFIGKQLSENVLNGGIDEHYKSFIKEIDPSISDIVVTKFIDSDGSTINKAETVHNFNGASISVPFSVESEGTNKMLFLAIPLLIALNRGTPLFIDELDSKLHPLLLRRIVQMFTNKETNPKGAQLIFSAHNIITLDSSDLRRDEIWFVEKEDHKSAMYSLVDFDDGGVRSDLNYGKHYLSGRFGAVPFQD